MANTHKDDTENEKNDCPKMYREFLESIGSKDTMRLGGNHREWERKTGWSLNPIPSGFEKMLKKFEYSIICDCIEYGEKIEEIFVTPHNIAAIYKRKQVKSTKYMKLDDLNSDMLQDAIILDFEGLKGDEPSLLGFFVDGEFKQICFDNTLKIAAIEKEIELRELNETLNLLIDKCIDEKRIMIGYSRREYDVFCEKLPERIKDINRVYLNALATKWFRRKYPLQMKILKKKKSTIKWKPNRSIGLKDFLDMELVCYNYPTSMKGVSPAKAIRLMQEQLKIKKNYTVVSRGVKRKWTMMLRYNKLDVLGLRYLLQWILNEQ